jgi:hypothetical protein
MTTVKFELLPVEENEELSSPPIQSSTGMNKNTHKSENFKKVPLVSLKADNIKLPEQKYVALSIIKKDDYGYLFHKEEQTYDGMLIKVRGVFATIDQADRHVKKIRELDPYFDVIIVKMFEWAKIDDDPEETHEDTVWSETLSHKIIEAYFRNEHNKELKLHERVKKMGLGEQQPWDKELHQISMSKICGEIKRYVMEKERKMFFERRKNEPRKSLTDLMQEMESDQQQKNTFKAGSV